MAEETCGKVAVARHQNENVKTVPQRLMRTAWQWAKSTSAHASMAKIYFRQPSVSLLKELKALFNQFLVLR